MNKKALAGLRKEEEIMVKRKETNLEIKDLEAELEWVNLREPDDAKYITFLMKRIDKLYEEMEKLDEIN